jgi:shikimate kinase
MGSGKTTIGTQLARQLAWRFVYLDDRIEDASGLNITEFFERHGETSFRLLKLYNSAQPSAALELREPAVLALGGGTAQTGTGFLNRKPFQLFASTHQLKLYSLAA